MLFKKEIKATKIIEEHNRREKEINIALEKFFLEYHNNDATNCLKQLGVLEYLKVKDIAFYSGLTYYLAKEYDNAIHFFTRVSPSSSYYKDALQGLATIYRDKGDYLNLHEILLNDSIPLNKVVQFNFRLRCLTNMELEEYEKAKESIYQLPQVILSSSDVKIANPNSFLELCVLICEILISTILEIKHCKTHNELFGKTGDDVENDLDLKQHTLSYYKYCHILSFINQIESINFKDNSTLFQHCALSNLTWAEKIKIVNSSTFLRNILHIIIRLLSTGIHVNVPEITVIGYMLSFVKSICPTALPEAIYTYFDTVKQGYLSKNENIVDAVEHVYASILSFDNDNFELKKKFDTFVCLNDNIKLNMLNMQFQAKLSPKAYNLLIDAEEIFLMSSIADQNNKDYSSLSLQYFRVIEIEINEKLILPLINNIKIDLLETYATEDLNTIKYRWNRDLKQIQKVKDGEKTTLEIGNVRELLKKINSEKKTSKFAQYLYSEAINLLTEDGKKAFNQELFCQILDHTYLLKYRVPGAHTGYVPYSIAYESRKHLFNNIIAMESWFIK